jgi:prefoldin subunit 5
VLAALSSLESTEEKLAALCKKYTDLLADHQQLQARQKQSQKTLTAVRTQYQGSTLTF